MRFYTALYRDRETVFASVDGGRTAYALTYNSLNEIIADPAALPRLREAFASGSVGESVAVAGLRLCAPIPVPRQDVICLGINYDEHAVEAGRFSDEAFGGERPYTIYFSKRVTRAGDPGGIIPSYTGLVDSLDYEAELGVILGCDVKAADEAAARNAIFGYTVINDVSARNLQTRHKQWYLGKSLDGFTPMGPCIVTPDELGDAGQLAIRCYVNGELRQNSNTRYMIRTVTGAICELSAGMTLAAGTIIATGTPAGVGMGMQPPCFLQPGDHVVCEIEGIGRLESTVGES